MNNPTTYSINEADLREMMQAIYDMRQSQRRYFSMPNDYHLKVAKTKEAKVDSILKEVAKLGLIKEKHTTAPPATQTSLL